MELKQPQELFSVVKKPSKSQNIFWLEGEESFFIDLAVKHAEQSWIPVEFRSYDMHVFYGKDSNVLDIISTCKRFPFQHDFQVVIIKEANALKDIAKLENYLNKPNPTTLLLVAHYQNKVDKRSKLGKIISEKSVYFHSKKVYDREIPNWINYLVQQKNIVMDKKAVELLIGHIGNNLSLINSELEKVMINLNPNSAITTNEIEKYIGINREYNIFELMEAIGRKDVVPVFKMLDYFHVNQKDVSSILIINKLFYYFKKILQVHTLKNSVGPKELAMKIGVHPFFLNQYLNAAKRYSLSSCHYILNLLTTYHYKDIGIKKFLGNKLELQKELVMKIINLP